MSLKGFFSRGKALSGKPPKHVWQAPEFTKAELLALKALAAGVANDEQQQLALRYIVFDLCGTYDWPYRPNEDETLLALGRQFVGKRIVHMVDVAEAPEAKT